jgi:hypothetical protein
MTGMKLSRRFRKLFSQYVVHYNSAGDLHIDILNDIPLGDGVIIGIGRDE